jgi:hypothetical protein
MSDSTFAVVGGLAPAGFGCSVALQGDPGQVERRCDFRKKTDSIATERGDGVQG